MKFLTALLLVIFTVAANELIDSKFDEAYFYYQRGEFLRVSSIVVKAYELAEREFKGQYALSDYAYDVAAIHQNIGK